MDFFKQIADLGLTGNLNLVINNTDGQTIVTLLLDNKSCGDKAAKMIAPLLLRGTPEEIDEAFFNKISAPLQKVSGLQINMEAHLKSVEEATKQSALAKKKEDDLKAEQKKNEDAKSAEQKAFEKAMLKTEELATAGKIREAIKALPDPEAHAEFSDKINKRRTELVAKLNEASPLFAIS